MRILFISRHFPADLRTCTYGTYQRMGMLIDAIKEIAELDILYYVPPEIEISPAAIATKQQELSEYWGAPIHLSLCRLFDPPTSTPKLQRHLPGIFNCFDQLLFFGTSRPEQVAAFEGCLERQPDLIFVHRLGLMPPLLLTSKALPPDRARFRRHRTSQRSPQLEAATANRRTLVLRLTNSRPLVGGITGHPSR
jgi:hypothetical protein